MTELHIEEAVLLAHYTAQRGRGWKLVGAALANAVVWSAAGVLVFEPLYVGTFFSFLLGIVGYVLIRLAAPGLRRRGDLVVRLDGSQVEATQGETSLARCATVASLIVEPDRVDLLLESPPPTAINLPCADPEALVSRLGLHGLPVNRPPREPLKVLGVLVAVVVGVGALLVVMKVAGLLALGGILAGIHWIAPDDPETQILLFFALAALSGLALLVRTVVRWRAASGPGR